MTPEQRERELERLYHKEEKLVRLLELVRMHKILLGAPRYRYPYNIYIVTLRYIRDNPGLTREEIMTAKDVPSYVLTQLNKEGLVFTTEVENRLRKYYIRPENMETVF